jgi:excisionase family DNA binding protein
METPHADTAQLVPALEQAIERVPSAAIPVLIGDLERLQALLAARLLREAWQAAPAPRVTSSLEDLQHLTPAQVAELLSLTEPYVHELCRTGRVRATKSGKYWMIPVAGLREWLVYPKRDVDDGNPRPVPSLKPRADGPPLSLTGPAGRPRRSLITRGG